MKARGEEKIEGKEINKESQVAGKERGRKKDVFWMCEFSTWNILELNTVEPRDRGIIYTMRLWPLSPLRDHMRFCILANNSKAHTQPDHPKSPIR